MDKLPVRSIMLDTSFLIRLMDNQDPLHANALEYFRHFRDQRIDCHVSTIAIAEYAVGDDPENLPLSFVKVEAFDIQDSFQAAKYHKELFGEKENIPGFNRRIIANDVKILGQIGAKRIEAIITRDAASYRNYIRPLNDKGFLNIRFYDLSAPLSSALGLLFTT